MAGGEYLGFNNSILLYLVKPEMDMAQKYDYVFDFFKKMAGGEYLGFNNSIFLSERDSADRNNALAYFMRENHCFPPGDIRLPATRDDWLHMVELVHMKLFLGMIIYFSSMLRIVQGSISDMRRWDSYGQHRLDEGLDPDMVDCGRPGAPAGAAGVGSRYGGLRGATAGRGSGECCWCWTREHPTTHAPSFQAFCSISLNEPMWSNQRFRLGVWGNPVSKSLP